MTGTIYIYIIIIIYNICTCLIYMYNVLYLSCIHTRLYDNDSLYIYIYSLAVLIYNKTRKAFVIVKQFRPGVYNYMHSTLYFYSQVLKLCHALDIAMTVYICTGFGNAATLSMQLCT